MNDLLPLKKMRRSEVTLSAQENIPQATSSSKTTSGNRLYTLGFAILFIIIGAVSYFAYTNYSELQKIREEKDAEVLKESLGKIYVLPEGDPIIASVNDVEKLRKEQPFYNKAENGDKIFIWGDKAVIYRPSLDKIVDFGIIISVTPTPTSTQTPQPTVTTTVSATPSRR